MRRNAASAYVKTNLYNIKKNKHDKTHKPLRKDRSVLQASIFAPESQVLWSS